MVLIVRRGCDVDMVEGLLPTSPGMNPRVSHAVSLLLVLGQVLEAWGSFPFTQLSLVVAGIFTCQCLT